MAPASQSPSEMDGVLEEIRKKLAEIWPAKGCPAFGEIFMRIILQNKKPVHVVGHLESKTDNRKNGDS